VTEFLCKIVTLFANMKTRIIEAFDFTGITVATYVSAWPFSMEDWSVSFPARVILFGMVINVNLSECRFIPVT